MLVYFLLGIIIMILGMFFEQKCSIRKIYFKLVNYISTNGKNWQIITDDIIQNKNAESLEKIFGEQEDAYLIIKETMGVITYALNDKKIRNISELQYMKIMKKLKKQNMFYTFNLDTASIYYRFDPPNENCILWIYVH